MNLILKIILRSLVRPGTSALCLLGAVAAMCALIIWHTSTFPAPSPSPRPARIGIRKPVQTPTKRLHPKTQTFQFGYGIGLGASQTASPSSSKLKSAMDIPTLAGILLASALIISIVLNMHLKEMGTIHAMLRLIGCSRKQILMAGTLHGCLLGAAGSIAGFASGVAFLSFIAWRRTGHINAFSLAPWGVASALLLPMLLTLPIAGISTHRATQTSLAEAANAPEFPATRHFSSRILTSLTLLLSLPIILNSAMEASRIIALCCILIPISMLHSLISLSPATIQFANILLGKATATLFRIPPIFLKTHLCSSRLHGHGGIMTLAAGLWLYTSIHIWASSMLTLFTIPNTLPPILARCHPDIAGPQMNIKIHHASGNARVMEICVEQPELAPSLQHRMTSAGALAGNTVIMGIDPELAWHPTHPMLRLPFIKGSPATARNAFAAPASTACVIPYSLALNAHLSIGDTLSIVAPDGNNATLQVAGIVDFPWPWFSKCSGIRLRHHRTSAVIFAPEKWVKSNLDARAGEYFWIEADEKKLPQIKDNLLKAAKRQIRTIPPSKRTRCFSGGTRWESSINRDFIQISDRTELNSHLLKRSNHVIQAMTQMPTVVMILSIFAIACTMNASVRQRERDFKIMRFCGATRYQLIRLVLSEGVLNGLAGCLLGTVLGFFHGWLSIRLAGIAPIFGMNAPALIIPMDKIAFGAALALVLPIAGSVIPAFGKNI